MISSIKVNPACRGFDFRTLSGCSSIPVCLEVIGRPPTAAIDPIDPAYDNGMIRFRFTPPSSAVGPVR
jgi:hypothetical protein